MAGNRRRQGGYPPGAAEPPPRSTVVRAARKGDGFGVMRYELRFGLLGTPVLFDPVDYDDAVHPVSSPKVRTLLAALLLEPGRVVSVDALKDALWGGSPPASAHASLHNHVTRLRRLLDHPERLRAVPPGYVLRVDEGELGVHTSSRPTSLRPVRRTRRGLARHRPRLHGRPRPLARHPAQRPPRRTRRLRPRPTPHRGAAPRPRVALRRGVGPRRRPTRRARTGVGRARRRPPPPRVLPPPTDARPPPHGPPGGGPRRPPGSAQPAAGRAGDRAGGGGSGAHVEVLRGEARAGRRRGMRLG